MRKVGEIDRRWVFLLLTIVLGGAMLFPFPQPVEPNVQVRKVYNFIDDLKPGDVVLLGLDFDPQAKAELQPMTKALLRHCFKKNLRVVGMTFWAVGADMAERIMDEVGRECKKVYGKDYVFLGYKPGGMAMVLTGMGENLKRTFDQDVRGINTSTMPVLKGVSRLKDFSLLVDLAAGMTVGGWVVYAGDKYKVPLVAGCTAVSGPDYYVYLDTKQLLGLIAGLRGVADYEKLIEQPGFGTRGMAAQTAAHVLIILLIIIGNIQYFRRRRRPQTVPALPPDEETQKHDYGKVVFAVCAVLFIAANVIMLSTGRLSVKENQIPNAMKTFGLIVGVFLTFAIFSFLYRDNPFFRATENLFVGVGLGVTASVTWYTAFKPQIYDKLIEPALSPVDRIHPTDYWLLVPITLGALMLTRISRRAGWLSRYTVAFLVGYGAGFSIQPTIHSAILKQSYQTVRIGAVSWYAGLILAGVAAAMIVTAWFASKGGWPSKVFPIGNVLLVLVYAGLKTAPKFAQATAGVDTLLMATGVITVMSYFFFSAEHRGVLGATSRFGIVVLMISFGASFGYTVMARESLLIGRLQFILGDWLRILPQ